MSYKAKFALIIAVILWASAFVGIRAGLQGYSPEGLALLRYLVASACMALFYMRLSQRNKIIPRDVIGMLLLGALGIGIYNITLNYGEQSVSSGMASFIISQSPLISTTFAVLFLGERLNFYRICGFFTSVCGVALISMGESDGLQWNASIIFLLCATVTGGGYSVLQKYFLKKYHAIEATTYVIWGGTLFLLFYTPQLRLDLQTASASATLTVIYLGIFPAAIGYAAWSYVLSEIPAARAVSFLYFMPFVATMIGWLWLNEVPAFLSIAGGVLAIFGVWLVNQSYIQQQRINLKSTSVEVT